MRSALATAATVTTIVLLSLSVDRTLAAEASPKQKDLVTVGASGLPESHAAERHGVRLQRASAVALAPVVAPPTAEKSQAIQTAEPAAMTAAQRAKFDAGLAAAPAPEAAAIATAKPASLSTILAAPAGAQVAQPSLEQKIANTAAAAHASPGVARTHSVTAALGAIPRPEWGAAVTREKPAEISTIGPPAPGAGTAPGPEELQRAATTTPSGAKKAPEVTTSRPRDPSLPPTQTVKSGDPSTSTPEVK